MKEEELLDEPNRYEKLRMWMGLPLKEKVVMILKQFLPGL